MLPFLFLIALPGLAPTPSADTETVQRIWVSNENRYGWGVIRGGRFIEATQPDPSQAATVGATANYGLIPPAAWTSHQQGYTSNDGACPPPVSPSTDPTPDATANPYGMAIFIGVSAVAAALVLAAIFIALIRGPAP